MSNVRTQGDTSIENPSPQRVDMKLEVAVLPVADVDRAKEFYSDLGWRLDADFTRADGSRRAVHTTGVASLDPACGGAASLSRRVRYRGGPRAELIKRGIDVSEVFHPGPNGRVRGPDPDRPSYSALATFHDPDGNAWLIQQVTQRLPGRVEADITFASLNELAGALRRAAAAHGEHGKQASQHDANWPDWYADYIVREQVGNKPA